MKGQRNILIHIDKIPEEGLDVTTKLADAIFGNEEDLQAVFYDNIDIFLHIDIVNNMVIATGKLKTDARLTCSRCTKKFKYSIKKNKLSYQKEITQKRDVIDLTPDIREDIIIALPIKSLCKVDCKGLCITCGQDLNLKQCNCMLKEHSSWHMQLEDIKLDKKIKKNVKREK